MRFAHAFALAIWLVASLTAATKIMSKLEKESKMMAAIESGNLDAVATLIDVLETSVNFNSDLPLRSACVYDRNDVAAFLLERGADVNAKSGEPLRIAVRKINRKLVEVLLEHDADARLSDNDALVTACEMGLEDITRALLKSGADPNARFGEPLRIAVRKNYKALVDLLTEHGADVRLMDNEALVTACELGRIDLVQALLRAGADPTARQHKCWRLARQHRNEGLMSVLRSSYFYLTPKYYRNFYSAVYGGDMNAVVAGLESGFDLHHGHDRALRMAASRGHVAMVKLLIQRGANPAALKYQALRLAAYQGLLEVVVLLAPLCSDREIVHAAANLAGRRGFDFIRNHLITIALNDFYSHDGAAGMQTDERPLQEMLYDFDQAAANVPEDWIMPFQDDFKTIDDNPISPTQRHYSHSIASPIPQIPQPEMQPHVQTDDKLQAPAPDSQSLAGLLTAAASKADVHNVERILNMGPPDLIHASDDIALRIASARGHSAVVTVLLRRGANIGALDHQALRLAAKQGHVDVVEKLLQVGGDLTACNHHALRSAVKEGHATMVQVLLQVGADVRAANHDAMRLAVAAQRCDLVDLLVQFGADVHANDEEFFRNATPAMRACLQKHTSAMIQ